MGLVARMQGALCGCLIMSRRRFAKEWIVKSVVGSRLTYPVANTVAYFV